MAEIIALMDHSPVLHGGSINVPSSWQEAVRGGARLVTVTTLPNGARAGYFQKTDAPMQRIIQPPPRIDAATSSPNVKTWFAATFKNKMRLRTGDVCKALHNFGLPSQPYDVKKLVDNNDIAPMKRLNGGKHSNYHRDKIMGYIIENCTEGTT